MGSLELTERTPKTGAFEEDKESPLFPYAFKEGLSPRSPERYHVSLRDGREIVRKGPTSDGGLRSGELKEQVETVVEY